MKVGTGTELPNTRTVQVCLKIVLDHIKDHFQHYYEKIHTLIIMIIVSAGQFHHLGSKIKSNHFYRYVQHQQQLSVLISLYTIVGIKQEKIVFNHNIANKRSKRIINVRRLVCWIKIQAWEVKWIRLKSGWDWYTAMRMSDVKWRPIQLFILKNISTDLAKFKGVGSENTKNIDNAKWDKFVAEYITGKSSLSGKSLHEACKKIHETKYKSFERSLLTSKVENGLTGFYIIHESIAALYATLKGLSTIRFSGSSFDDDCGRMSVKMVTQFSLVKFKTALVSGIVENEMWCRIYRAWGVHKMLHSFEEANCIHIDVKE